MIVVCRMPQGGDCGNAEFAVPLHFSHIVYFGETAVLPITARSSEAARLLEGKHLNAKKLKQLFFLGDDMDEDMKKKAVSTSLHKQFEHLIIYSGSNQASVATHFARNLDEEAGNFVHLRSCHIFPNGDFTEASHLGGRADLIELCRIFEKENPQLPMRVDHGMTFTDEPGGIMDESSHGHNAGYTLLGRMFALGQVQGILATVDRELGIPYKQPGFFD